MIRIAYCDDDATVLEQLGQMLLRYRARRTEEMTWKGYADPQAMLADAENTGMPDVLLLDIFMPECNGMDVAQEIRARSREVRIIFLTTTPDYAVRSYDVGAHHYLLKPVTEAALFPVLDRALDGLRREKGESILLRCKNGITSIDPAHLQYCEVQSHRLLLHLQDGSVLESSGKLDVLEEQLVQRGGFLRVHRSYLVNLGAISSINYRAVTLSDGAMVPIPHGKFGWIKEKYLQYAFEEGRVLL